MNPAVKNIILKTVFLCGAYIACMMFLSAGLSLDQYVSDLFFHRPCDVENVRSCWFFDKSDPYLTFVLHNMPVNVVTVFATLAAILWLSTFLTTRTRKYRTLGFMLVLAMAAFPGAISLLKHYTGHYCPGQLGLYGGPVGLVDTNMKPRCFPAGFPSPGFGLMILYFSDLPLKWRRGGLWAGLGLGTLFSIIQIARGEHYLSHNIATLLSAVFIGGLVFFFNQYRAVCSYASTNR